MNSPARTKTLAAAFQNRRNGLLAEAVAAHQRIERIRKNAHRDPAHCNADSLAVAEQKLAEAVAALKEHDQKAAMRLGQSAE